MNTLELIQKLVDAVVKNPEIATMPIETIYNDWDFSEDTFEIEVDDVLTLIPGSGIYSRKPILKLDIK